MIKGKTKSGFVFEIDEEAKDDMELLEGLIQIDQGDLRSIPNVLVMLLGEEQKKALYDHCRGEDGVVPLDRVAEEMKDIFEAFSEDPNGKN